MARFNPYTVPAVLALAGLFLVMSQFNLDFVIDIDIQVRVPVTYQASDLDFPNPERGLYSQYTYDPDGVGGPAAIAATDLLSDRLENKTLLLRLYYLSDFLPDDPATEPPVHIPQSFLDFLSADFETIRETGQKAILRFAYQSVAQAYPCDIVHDQDPGVEQILMHISDMGPVLTANSDVIAVVQAGFIGTWGEWFYVNQDFADIALAPPDCETDCTADCQLQTIDYKYHARREVVNALMEHLPPDRAIQLRTPLYKNEMYGSGGYPGVADALGFDSAFKVTSGARLGHHNDCFLAPFKESGTYSYDPVAEASERDYLELETRFLPMGGETCQHNSPASCCDQAVHDLARFHWSYLNSDYNNCVLATWGKTWADSAQRARDLSSAGCDPVQWPPDDCSGDCYDDIRKQLGYRFRLLSGDFPFFAVSTGCEMHFVLTLRNDGYAAPFNPRDVELIFRSRHDPSIRYAARLDEDPRLWLPGRDIELRHAIFLPDDMIADEYDLMLHLPDPKPSLRGDPRHTIRLANSGGSLSPERDLLWEEPTGYNDLQIAIKVEYGADTEPRFTDAAQVRKLPCGPSLTASGSHPGTGRDEVVDNNESTGFNSTHQSWQHVEVDLGCVTRLYRFRRHMSAGDPHPSPHYRPHPEENRGGQGEHVYYSLDGEKWIKATAANTTGWEQYTLYPSLGSAWYFVDYDWSAWLEFNDPPYARYVRFQWDGNFDMLNEIAVNE
jgi:hypothetical protein